MEQKLQEQLELLEMAAKFVAFCRSVHLSSGKKPYWPSCATSAGGLGLMAAFVLEMFLSRKALSPINRRMKAAM